MLSQKRRSHALNVEPLEPRTMLTASLQLVNHFDHVAPGMNRPSMDLIAAGDTTYAVVKHRTGDTYSGSVWVVEAETPLLTQTDVWLRDLEVVDDQLYFVVRPIPERNEPMELWKTDGTAQGTSRLLILSGEWEFFPSAQANGMLFFTQRRVGLVGVVEGQRWTVQEQLWVVQGTEARVVKEFKLAERGRWMGEFADTLAFTVNNNFKTEIWTSDGSREGTSLLTTIPIRNGDIEGVVGNTLLIRDDDMDVLWRTDGTEEGTYRLSNVKSDRFTVMGDRMFYLANTEATGQELWVTDGTVEGTHLVKDIVPGRNGCGLAAMVPVGDTLFFLAQDADGNEGLWKSDGTEEGTVLVKDQRLVPLFSANGMLYLRGYDEATGRELWRSDGTAEGTALAFDLAPGPGSSLNEREIPKHAVSNDTLYLADWNWGHESGISEVDIRRIPLDPELPGDADANGTVGFEDFTALAANFGKTHDAVFADGDFDSNGRVDFADFLILAANFGVSHINHS